MLNRSNLRLAVRRLWRARGFAVINILGLATGFVCCLFIAAYVADEHSYDRFHDNAGQIVRVVENKTLEGTDIRLATTYGPLAPALDEAMASIEQTTRVYPHGLLLRTGEGEDFHEDDILFVDSTFLDVFSFEKLSGQPGGALTEPFSFVLTRRAAERLFGTTEVVGRTVRARDGEDVADFTVTGVVENPPHNTHLQFDILASFSSATWLYGDWIDDPQNWEHPALYTYAVVGPGTDLDVLSAGIAELGAQIMGPRRSQTRTLAVERLTDIRLHSGRQGDLAPSSSAAHVSLLTVIALIVLALACINFGNLTAAHGASRVAEFGTRKAMGAGRAGLINLLLSESVLLALLSLAAALAAVVLLLPAFNALSGKALEAPAFFSAAMVVPAALVAMALGILSAAYPAAAMSRLDASGALRRGFQSGRPLLMRFSRALVVLQFVACVALVVGTLTVREQVNLLVEERLGFDKEHVLVVPLRDLADQVDHDSFLDAVRALPGVEAATASSGMPGLDGGAYRWKARPQSGSRDSLELAVLMVEPDYAETYGLEVVAGRDFGRDFVSDATSAFLLNEAAAESMGWTAAEAVDRVVELSFWFERDLEKTAMIVGVVKNFQYHSLHRTYDPMLFQIVPGSYYYDYVSVRLSPAGIPATVDALEATWAEFNPGRPFEYEFVDQRFDALYRSEMRLAGLFGVFAGLAMVVACLGLFGLASMTTARRTKEIGVRKVLGASVAGVLGLLTVDLLRPVVVALILAIPAAMVLVDAWLGGYAEHVRPSAVTAVVAAVIALGVSWVAVGYSAIRAAVADPVKSLRYE